VNNKENAVNTRLRSTTRAKPPSTVPSTSEAKPAGITRATASTVATRAKTAAAASSKIDLAAQGKRKREALGEVPRPPVNVVRDAPKDASTGLKGKAKAKETFDGIVLKKQPPSSVQPFSTTKSVKPPSVTRQTTRVASSTATTVTTTSTRRTRSTTQQHVPQVKQQTVLEEVPEEEEEPQSELAPAQREQLEENAMAIDAHLPPAPVPAPRRFTAARSSIAMSSSRVQIQQRVRQVAAAPLEVDDEEDVRAYKKRRTSSEAPEDDWIAEQEVEKAVREDVVPEADPDGDQWDDLDAEDADDPLMVSEYVNDIFHYLKEVEVCGVEYVSFSRLVFNLGCSKRRCPTQIIWKCKRILPGTCEASLPTGCAKFTLASGSFPRHSSSRSTSLTVSYPSVLSL
jgi:G2/mitotic-specific cyclin 2